MSCDDNLRVNVKFAGLNWKQECIYIVYYWQTQQKSFFCIDPILNPHNLIQSKNQKEEKKTLSDQRCNIQAKSKNGKAVACVYVTIYMFWVIPRRHLIQKL